MSKVRWIDGQAFANYEHWECYLSGMYRSASDAARSSVAVSLLSNGEHFNLACRLVVSYWPVSAAVHMSARAKNRRAYLGAAACCLIAKATEMETRLAWWSLTEGQQMAANAVAEVTIAQWDQEHTPSERYLRQSGQLVFPFLTLPVSA